MLDAFTASFLPCPICQARHLRGGTCRVAGRLCVVCRRCQYHCACGTAQKLVLLRDAPWVPDLPLLVDENEPAGGSEGHRANPRAHNRAQNP